MMIEDIKSCIRQFLCKLHGLTDDHNYSPAMHTLFSSSKPATISDQEAVNLLWCLLEEMQTILENSFLFPKKLKSWMDNIRPTCDHSTQTSNAIDFNDSKFVQITCTKQELDHRINSFIKRKRIESDAFNRHEFCKIHDEPNIPSCARTDAVYVRRQSAKSLVKIKTVHNNKQTKCKKEMDLNKVKHWPPLHPSSTLPFHSLPTDLKERMINMNLFLSPLAKQNENLDVYKQMRNMEERLLYLETLSPEYFKQRTIGDGVRNESNISDDFVSPKYNKQSCTDSSDNTMLLDMRIKELQRRLKRKSI